MEVDAHRAAGEYVAFSDFPGLKLSQGLKTVVTGQTPSSSFIHERDHGLFLHFLNVDFFKTK